MHFRFLGESIFNMLTIGASKETEMMNDNKYESTSWPKKVIIWKSYNMIGWIYESTNLRDQYYVITIV